MMRVTMMVFVTGRSGRLMTVFLVDEWPVYLYHYPRGSLVLVKRQQLDLV
jgi:hypothetical protein